MKKLLFALMIGLVTSCNLHKLDLDPENLPCVIAGMTVFDDHVRFNIRSIDSLIHIQRPYQGYLFHDTMARKYWSCLGFYRTCEDFTIEIWDSKQHCTFLVPALEDCNQTFSYPVQLMTSFSNSSIQPVFYHAY